MKRIASVSLFCGVLLGSIVAPAIVQGADNKTVTIPDVPAAPPATSPIRKSSDVQAVFNKTKDDVFGAFKERRKEKPDLNGKVVFDITIEPNGKVSDASKVVSSTLNDPTLENKLLDVFKKLDFGKALRPEKFSFQFPVDFPKDGWDKKEEPKADGKSSDKV